MEITQFRSETVKLSSDLLPRFQMDSIEIFDSDGEINVESIRDFISIGIRSTLKDSGIVSKLTEVAPLTIMKRVPQIEIHTGYLPFALLNIIGKVPGWIKEYQPKGYTYKRLEQFPDVLVSVSESMETVDIRVGLEVMYVKQP